jgi:hypothetical protein
VIYQILKKKVKMEVIGEIKEMMMAMQIEDSEDNPEVVITLVEEDIQEVDIKIKEEDIKIKEVAGVIKIEEVTVVEKKLGIAIMMMKNKIIIKIVETKIGEDKEMIMDITKKEELRVDNRNIVQTSDLEQPQVSKEQTCQL